MKKKIAFSCQLVLSVLFLYFALSLINFRQFIDVLENGSVLYLVIMVGIVFGANYILALRWKTLIDFDIRVIELFKINMCSRFFSFFLPGKFSGDAYRIFILGSRCRNIQTSTLTIILDRYIGQTILFFIGTIVVLINYNVLNNIISNLTLAVFFSSLAFPVIGYVIFINFNYKVFLKKIKIDWDALGEVFKSARFKKTIFFSAIYQLFYILSIYFSFLIFNETTSFLKVLVAVPIISILLIIPASIHGVGQREAIYVYIFSTLGINGETAISASLASFFANVIVSLLGGFFYLSKKFNQVKKNET